MQELKPIIEKSRYYKPVEEVIVDFLVKHFYAPLFQIIEPIEEYYNSTHSSSEQIVSEAIRKGQIQYVNGKFSGQFTAEISKALRELGAKFNKVTKTYNLAQAQLSININEAIAYASVIAMTRQKLVLEALSSMTIEKAMPELQQLLDVPLDTMLDDLSEQAQLTLKKAITIVPEITPEQREAIKAQYVDDVSISIKNFTQKQTEKLRAMVEENVFTGLADNRTLVKAIMEDFGVAERKAAFLSRQETSLFVAKYREITYKEAGITKYRWSMSHDERVRPFHKDLDKKIFTWDNSPITNENGDRNHPGEDFGCRCVAIPIID